MELIQTRLVQLKIKAKNWKEAIIKAGYPLVKNGLVTEHYIESVIKIAEDIGPYIVFMPHVALSHAKTEDGALKDGIGLTILDTPVKFGNENNDPVKYIFTLSSTKPDGHLKQLTKLVKVLSLENFFEEIDKMKSAEEVTQCINKLEKE